MAVRKEEVKWCFLSNVYGWGIYATDFDEKNCNDAFNNFTYDTFRSADFGSSEIFDFVHKDYDFVLRISKSADWYTKSISPFFLFALNRKGLGFEDSFIRTLEDTEI